jgi:homoserine/homoserine lactone efflux protein
MDATLILSFLSISFLIIIIPGPNVLVIVATSVSHGKVRGLQTVAGTSSAMAIQLIVAAVGTSWLVQLLSNGFYVLKWLGVVYLAYLGVTHLRRALSKTTINTPSVAISSFSRGFVVSLTNPKTILFFSAFLPQFVSSSAPYLPQIMALSLMFLLLAIVLDSCYALLSSKLALLIESSMVERIQSGLTGALFLGASTWLAILRRT